jgi:catechol 2,3-dioxygenase-like lactoylglutathione lyase family enzyme
MIGHVDLRVRNLEEAVAFYELLLPALGFVHRYHGGDWKVWASDEQVYVALTGSTEHVANASRIAFRAEDAAHVDRVAEIARSAGAAVSGPKEMPYGPGYYAAYFDDPSGNPLEVYVRP